MLKSGVLMFPIWDLTFPKLQPADQSAVLISATQVGFLILSCRCTVFNLRSFALSPVTGVLDEPFSQITPLSGVAAQARQCTWAETVSILCSLTGRFGYSAELA
jgi:hypothetical protein